jgi:hypothetical protein
MATAESAEQTDLINWIINNKTTRMKERMTSKGKCKVKAEVVVTDWRLGFSYSHCGGLWLTLTELWLNCGGTLFSLAALVTGSE